MARFHLFQGRPAGAALLGGIFAAEMERAAGFRHTGHIRGLSLNGVQSMAARQVLARHRPDQAQGIGVMGIFKDLKGVPLLHNFAAVHDLD